MQVCVDCTTVYSVGAPQCPHCGVKEFRLSSDPEGQVYVAGDDGPVPVAEPAPEKPVDAGGEKAK
jgi:hypothetical protein